MLSFELGFVSLVLCSSLIALRITSIFASNSSLLISAFVVRSVNLLVLGAIVLCSVASDSSSSRFGLMLVLSLIEIVSLILFFSGNVVSQLMSSYMTALRMVLNIKARDGEVSLLSNRDEDVVGTFSSV